MKKTIKWKFLISSALGSCLLHLVALPIAALLQAEKRYMISVQINSKKSTKDLNVVYSMLLNFKHLDTWYQITF